MNVLWIAERQTPQRASLSTILVTSRRRSLECLVGKHKFIIMLRDAGWRPGDACHPEEGIFCFGSFFKRFHSLCGGVNVLITIVIGTHGGLVMRVGTNDCVAHFFGTTAILIFLPSTKKKEIKDPAIHQIWTQSLTPPSFFSEDLVFQVSQAHAAGPDVLEASLSHACYALSYYSLCFHFTSYNKRKRKPLLPLGTPTEKQWHPLGLTCWDRIYATINTQQVVSHSSYVTINICKIKYNW